MATIPDDIITKLNLKEAKKDWVGNSRLYKLRLFKWFDQFGIDYLLLESDVNGNPTKEANAVTVMARGPRFYAYIVVGFELLTQRTEPWLRVNLAQQLSKKKPRQHFFGTNPGK